jgi:membrane-associated protease RseP (regulator of RpoE activity)
LEPARPASDETGLLAPPPTLTWQRHPKFQDRVWLHALLLVLTIATTTMVGAEHYRDFRSDFLSHTVTISRGALLLRGLLYSVTVLAILGAHEFGHYLACRYYDVDASLPYFLPFPPILFLGTLTGTFGAVIRIREPMQNKRVLFDVGVAGPIAGFLVLVPALVMGISLSNVVRLPQPMPAFTLELGEPLLFRAVSWIFFGPIPDGYSLNMHPMAWAAWFGLLATAMNLFPVGQLDGGHVSYAVLGRRSTYVTFAMLGMAILLIYFSPTWLFWTVLMILMLALFGPRHPRTYDEHVPLDRPRLIVATCTVAMFVLCFTPVPINQISAFFLR